MNLSETSLLLTRPRVASERFASEVQSALGPVGEICISPLIDIVPLPLPDEVRNGKVFAFTSENAARVFSNTASGKGRRAYCVGQRTAQAARAAGFETLQAGGDVAALTQVIRADAPSDPVLHLGGRHQSGDLAGALTQSGLRAKRHVIYDQEERPFSAAAHALLNGDGDVVAPVFSPRTARIFRGAMPPQCARIHLVALSRAVAEAWGANTGQGSVTIARDPTSAAMIAAMAGLIDAGPLA